MRKLAWLLLLLSPPCWAQYVTITGTVHDTNGTVYQNGSGRATLVPANQAYYFNQNNPVQSPVVTVGLDAFGHFSMVLNETDLLTPASPTPQWQFSFCSAPYAQPATYGPICFTMTPLTLTTNQDITSTITPQAAILPLFGGYSITSQNQGSNLFTHNSAFNINCSTGMNCSDNGTTFTLTSSVSSGIGTSSVGCYVAYSTTTTVSGNCSLVDASKQTGSDFCAKVSASFGKLTNAKGAVIDARNFTTGQTCTATPFPNSTGNEGTVILLPPVTITTNVEWTPPSGVSLIGADIAFGTRATPPASYTTTIAASGTFPTNTPVIACGTIDSCNGNVISHLAVLCDNLTGVSAIDAESMFGGKIIDVQTGQCSANDILLHNGTFNEVRDVVISTTGSSSSSGYGIRLNNETSTTVNGVSFGCTTCQAGILVSGGSGLTISRVASGGGSSSALTSSLLIDTTGTTSSNFSNINGSSIFGPVTIVTIQSASQNRGLMFTNIGTRQGGTCDSVTNLLVDSVTTHTITNVSSCHTAQYGISEAASPTVCSSSLSVCW